MKKRKFATIIIELSYQDGGGGVPNVQELATFVQNAIAKHQFSAGVGGAIAYGDYTVTGVQRFLEPNG